MNLENLKMDEFEQQNDLYSYVAPEWFSNQMSIFTDIFAFGCLVYEIYSCNQVKDGSLEFSEKLPPKISYLVKKWLSYEPTDRPHILEIADFLEAL